MKSIITISVLLLLCFFQLSYASTQQVMMVLGYDGQSWYPYTVSLDKKIKNKSWRKIKSIKNPIQVTRQTETGQLFVKKDNGEIVTFIPNGKKYREEVSFAYLQADKSNYTQLRADATGVLAVNLINGKSQKTNIIELTDKDNNAVINQASAQFHPLRTNNYLFYAHVSCRLACDPVIQEVWQRNRITGKTKQVTLFNSTSYLHSVSADEKFAYISSNQAGYYHIGRLDLSNNSIDWLTNGQVTDSYPSIAKNNRVYFIRRDQQGTRLMYLAQSSDGKASQLNEIPLPKSIQKIRYLEISDL